MDPDELVKIYTVTDPNQAEIIKVALESEGIRCELGGTAQGGFTGIWDIDITVRAQDADRALKIIQSRE